MNYTKKRDKNEPGIIEALVAAGAVVTCLDDSGVPDLLVGYKGRTYLLEVKYPDRKDGKGHSNVAKGGEGELTAAQVKWWKQWTGAPAVIVHSEVEALTAIGADR